MDPSSAILSCLLEVPKQSSQGKNEDPGRGGGGGCEGTSLFSKQFSKGPFSFRETPILITPGTDLLWINTYTTRGFTQERPRSVSLWIWGFTYSFKLFDDIIDPIQFVYVGSKRIKT